MSLEGHTCKNPRGILTDEQIAVIHRRTLDVLEEVGVVFEGEEAIRILESGGCEADHTSGRVRFPGRLVKECIGRCPSSFTIKARNPKYDLEVGDPRVYFQSCPGLYISDLETGERREPVLDDVGKMVRILDALEEIHIALAPTGTIADKPPQVIYEWIMAEAIRNTEKVVAGANFYGCAKWMIEMARVTDQQIYGQVNPTSPLTYTKEQIRGGLLYVRSGNPICICTGPVVGATSPATLAGTLVLQNAEHLAGVLLLQLDSPGAPVTLASYPHIMDMRTGLPYIGGVEIGLLGVALAQIARHYGIPSHPEFPWSDSKTTDEQAAYEKAMQIVLCALAGSNLMTNGGGLEGEKLWSPVQLVIDNEINAMAGRILDGINVTDETLAVDIIKEVGPLPGNYLKTRHTQVSWRAEQFIPRLSDRVTYETWVKQGSKDVVERARERALDILRTHEVPPLSKEQDREVDRIVKAAEKEKLGL